MKTSTFIFRNARFEPTDDSVSDEVFEKDYAASQNAGNEFGLNYTLYRHNTLSHWVVVFSTSSECCDIRVETWPDLIDLLGKLSSIVLASVVDDDFCNCLFELFEPARNRIESRRVRP